IYAKSQLHVATPCRWLMQKVEQSMLAPAVSTSRVVPTGVDLSVFRAGDKSAARALLNLPQEARILVFAAHGVRHNIWRDYDMLQNAVVSFGNRAHASKTVLVALGEVGVGEGRSEIASGVEIRFVPRQGPEIVAAYCQAADLYIHAARADTFPRAVLE